MSSRLLSAPDFYSAVADYMHRVDPSWGDDRWRAQLPAETRLLDRLLGRGDGRKLLDCSCGAGGQAIPLAKLGWQVTATDISESQLDLAAEHASHEGANIDFRLCDMRDLKGRFDGIFDRVVSCMALDNVTDAADLRRSVEGISGALKPGGSCYIRLRDLDNIIEVMPRYDFKEERTVPHGRVIRLEDWEYEGGAHLVCTYVFLREDGRKRDWPWSTDLFSYRRMALLKSDLERLMLESGFEQVRFLPQASRWSPYEVIGSRASD